MAIQHRNRRHSFLPFVLFLSVFICVHLWFLSPKTFAQETGDQEVAVNLAEGRVVICAAKDGIVLAAMDAPGEADSRVPAITALSEDRMGVVLGAVEWVRPDSTQAPIRLDNEFHLLVSAALNTSGRAKEAETANDIESIGIAILERVRQLAGLLHHKVNLGEDEPLLRVVLAGYVRDYGPEVWTIDYRIQQDDLGKVFGGRASCARATTSFILPRRASRRRSWRFAIRRRIAQTASRSFWTCCSRMIRASRNSARRMKFWRSP